MSHLYSASHHNWIDTGILSSCAVWTEPPDGGFYTSTGLNAGLNLSLAMIQEDYGAYLVSQTQRAPIRFSHEAVNHIVRVKEESGHGPVRSNAVDIRTLEGARARARNVELNELAVLIAHEAVTHI